MKKYDKITPEGTKDFLFEECELRRKIENKIKNLFLSRSFSEVITPTIEFFDVYTKQSCYLMQEDMYKLIDQKGRILVLRPDSTAPIARLAATRLKNSILPIRLFYNQDVYSVNRKLSGRNDISTQIGVELIGSDTKTSDLEMLALAFESMQKICENGNFRIEIGNVGIFKILSSKLNVSDEIKEQIRSNIESKNYAALNDVLNLVDDCDEIKALRKLPELFGGEEVFDKAEELLIGEDYSFLLNYLKEIYHFLKSLGFEKNILIDLGIVNKIDYYTGIIFKGYIENLGDVILSGGRYDKLIGEYGKESAAIGFGINIDQVINSMKINDLIINKVNNKILVVCDNGFNLKSLIHLQRLNDDGFVTEIFCYEDKEKAINYAKEKGIKQINFVSDKIETINV